MIAQAPALQVGDVVIAYVRQAGPPRTGERPDVRSITVKTIGLTGMVWTYNWGTDDEFRYNDVEYVLRNGRWKRA